MAGCCIAYNAYNVFSNSSYINFCRGWLPVEVGENFIHMIISTNTLMIIGIFVNKSYWRMQWMVAVALNAPLFPQNQMIFSSQRGECISEKEIWNVWLDRLIYIFLFRKNCFNTSNHRNNGFYTINMILIMTRTRERPLKLATLERCAPIIMTFLTKATAPIILPTK